MIIMTLFLWMITAVMWFIYFTGVIITKKFNNTELPMFWIGLYTFVCGLIPVFYK